MKQNDKDLDEILNDVKSLKGFEKNFKAMTNNRKEQHKNSINTSTGQFVEDLIFNSLGVVKEGKVEALKSRLKEKKLKKAPNIIEWIINSEYMNSPESLKFTRCMQVLHQFYELICPACECKVFKNPDLIWNMKPIEIQNIHRFENGKCPRCGLTKLEMRQDGLLNDYYEFIGVAGMRSGKSVTTGGLIGTYQLHKALCYDDIPSYFGGMIERQRLTMTFIATSGKQAAGTVWEYFTNAFDMSPWFAEYVSYLKTLEKSLTGYNVGDLFKRNTSEIWFKNKNIYCDSANSNSASLAGATRLLSVIDEFAKFDYDSGSKRSADEVYRMMKKSLRTMRSLSNTKAINDGDLDPLTGILATCSSPISVQDKLMQQYHKAKKQKKVFAFKYATWEFNPTIKREDLVEEFEDDYIGAMRDYAAEPPGAKNPYVINLDRINSCQDVRKPLFNVQFYNRDADLHDGNMAKFIGVGISDCIFDKEGVYAIALDPGLNNHGFGISVLRLDLEDEKQFKVIVEAIIELLPTTDPLTGLVEREVDFLCIVPLLESIAKNLNVRYVTCDRWQSESILQDIQAKGIPIKKVNTGYTMYLDFKRDFNVGNIRFIQAELPREEWTFKMKGQPYSKVLLELMTLEDDGKKVAKAKDGSDDLIQPVVRGAALLRETYFEKSNSSLIGVGLHKKKSSKDDRYYHLSNAISAAGQIIKKEEVGTFNTMKRDIMPNLGGMIQATLGQQSMFLGQQQQKTQTKVISMNNTQVNLPFHQLKPKFKQQNQRNPFCT